MVVLSKINFRDSEGINLYPGENPYYDESMKTLGKTFFAALVALFAVLTALPVFAGSSREAEGAPVRIIPVRGDIEPSLAAFVRREARKAQNENAEVIIFEIDTFGGRVDTALQIASFIMSVNGARTVAWVRGGESSMGVSWSAGALIALSCAEIFMAPGTSIGAAAPVSMAMDGTAIPGDEKTVAAVRSQMAALAERNNHPRDIALAMVDFDVDLWEAEVDGRPAALSKDELERLEAEGAAVKAARVISPPGKLLSLTAGEAVRYGLAKSVAGEAELLAALGVSGAVAVSNPGAADTVISLLTSGAVQVILIVIGVVMLFLELNTPGFGIPGIASFVCFLLVFGSGLLLGRVDSLEIILFIIGLGLLAVELFVLPGFGVIGISGFLLIGLSLVFSMQDFVLPRFDWEWELLGRNAMVVFAGLVAAITGIAVIALMGPRIRLFDGLTLKTRITGTAGGPDPDNVVAAVPPREDEENLSLLAGKIGVADSVLRPSGRALIDGTIYAVEADGEFIESGRGIIVTRVRGNRIIVRRV